MLAESQEPACKKSARIWLEMLELSLCKINKLSRYVPKNYSIYYYRTYFKTTACDDIAKIMYVAIEKHQKTPSKSYKQPIYITVCVPVGRDVPAWVDDRCPFDDCKECKEVN